MNRFVFAAIIALGLMLACNGETRANGCGGPWGFVPGHITLQGSLGLSWGNIGFGNLNNWPPSYGAGYGPAGYGMGYHAAPMHHPYGYVYPAGYGY